MRRVVLFTVTVLLDEVPSVVLPVTERVVSLIVPAVSVPVTVNDAKVLLPLKLLVPDNEAYVVEAVVVVK